MSVYKHENSPYYHYDFQLHGHRFHGSTGAKSKREAEGVERLETGEGLRQHAEAGQLRRPSLVGSTMLPTAIG